MRKLALKGNVYSRLLVLEEEKIEGKHNSPKNVHWKCKCDCGNTVVVAGQSLTRGLTKSCGCFHKEQTSKKNKIDLTGKVFGRLAVIKESDNRKGGGLCWECLCSCGETALVRSYSLQTGDTTSCGCFHREQTSKASKTHGKTFERVYKSWTGMRSRCNDPNHNRFRNYGGRGIKVCDSWLNSFEQFYLDMGDQPSGKHSLDRINTDGDYCKENCRWATSIQQQNNTTRNHHLKLKGVTRTVAEWGRVLGFSPHTIHTRLRAGWSTSEALTTPVGGKRK